MYSVGGREVKCTVLREGKSGVHCQGMGSQEYSVRGSEIKCTLSREGKSSVQCQGKGYLV